jgi:signal recognition particle GTPase
MPLIPGRSTRASSLRSAWATQRNPVSSGGRGGGEGGGKEGEGGEKRREEKRREEKRREEKRREVEVSQVFTQKSRTRLTLEFYQTSKKNLTVILLSLFHKIQSEITLSNTFQEVTIILITELDHDTTEKENYRLKIVWMNIDAKNS